MALRFGTAGRVVFRYPDPVRIRRPLSRTRYELAFADRTMTSL